MATKYRVRSRASSTLRTMAGSRRTLSRWRFYIPLIVSVVLFGLYWVLASDPSLLRDRDPRAILFGKDLSYLLFAAYIALIVLIVRLFDAVAFDFVASRKKHIVAPILLREIVSIVLYLGLFAATISAVFNRSIAGLLTTTTVLAAVIGLALQDTLGNLFSGISLHMENTYAVGDVIRSGEFIGVVEVMNWRATRIRGFNDQVIVLPNSVIARERIEIFQRNHLSARTVSVGIDYHVPPIKAMSVLERAVENVEHVSARTPPLVRIHSFGDSSVVYEVKYWTDHYHMRDQIDAEVRKVAWYALRRNDIPIPFPIRNLVRYQAPRETQGLTRSDLIDHLMGVDLLSPLSEAEHATLSETTRIHAYGHGETILRFGEAGDSMFIIHEGTVAIRIPDTDHQMSEIAQLGSGSVFGEMALLTGESRVADVVALTDTVVLEIDKKSLQPILSGNPDLASAMTATILQRRDVNAESRIAEDDEKTSILSRIRSYFSIG
ncbi:MAG TPA: mechanosensitive ion channel family protein [Thermoanaerobaculia bacterium]|nr:mechanosensitive ion channel family protein [Thermoanaerobaculia bacterium]